jgi:hypothetical protein
MPPPRHDFESHLDLKARHGYHLSVVGEGNVVAVEVTQPSRHKKKNLLEKLFGLERAVTAYVARGTVKPNRIAASFGKLGRIDVRFKPSGNVDKSHSRRNCAGADHFTSRLGVFVGKVRFEGEKHYVAVDAHRAKGHVRSPLRLHCRFRRPRSSQRLARPVRQHPSFIPTFLSATSRHGVAGTELLVLQARTSTFALAISEESLGRMAKIRYAVASGKEDALTVNDALTGAKLRLPSPFHGTASYGAAADGTTSWSGSFAVSFPGSPRLSLTGDQYEVELGAGY